MRKSFDGLSGLVLSEFSREPNDGSLFLFINRRRDRIKILYWEVGGFARWYKRLKSGSFETVTGRNGESAVAIDAAELMMGATSWHWTDRHSPDQDSLNLYASWLPGRSI